MPTMPIRILFAAALLGLPGAPAAAESPGGVVILFDGSGSMWGRLEGTKETKFQAAREALAKALPKVAPGVPVGLAAYGHRRRGDCGDVELVQPPKPRDAEALMAAIDRLNPKGKGPLAAGLREAARTLAGRQQASIVVVHDGADNCNQDVCAAAADIAKSAPKLAIHSVGIALEGEDAARTACMARVTGGKAFAASDAEQLTRAVQEALRLAALDHSVPAPQPAARSPAPVAKKAPAGATGLQLSARLPGEAAPLAVPISWRITNSKTGEVAYEGTNAGVAVPLPAGAYAVEARIGILKGRLEAEVSEGATSPANLVLEAGALRLAVRNIKGEAPVQGALVSILPRTTNGVTGQPLWLGRSPVSELLLPAGNYVVRAEQGLVRREEAAAITSGGTADMELLLGSGVLEPTAVTHDDGEPVGEGVSYIVSEDDPKAPGGRREIARSAAPSPTFVLPAGTYYLGVGYAGTEARQRIGINAGETVKRAVPLSLGRLTANVSLPPQAKGASPVLRLVRLDGEAGEQARVIPPGREQLVPSGRYRVEALAGPANARITREIELRPGRPHQVNLAIEAGLATLRLLDRSNTAYADVYWEVRDALGRVVLRTIEREPSVLLAPGHYAVRGEARDKAGESKLVIANGETRTVETRVEQP